MAQPEVQARLRRLQAAAFGRLYSAKLVVGYMLVIAGGPTAFIVGLVSNDRIGSIAVGLVVLGIGALILLPRYWNRNARLAMELFNDHNCHERAEWKRETGTRMPLTLKAAERWLVEHPTGPNGAGLLLALGRVAEVDERMAKYVPDTPDHAFDVELLRETRALALAEPVDIDGLLGRIRDLPDPRERRHRRECVALLEAQLATDRGEDPVAVLARARMEIDDVYWRYKTAWALGILFVGGAALVVFGGLLGAAIGFRGLS